VVIKKRALSLTWSVLASPKLSPKPWLLLNARTRIASRKDAAVRPTEVLPAAKELGFGAARKGLIVSKSEGKKGRSPSDRKLGASQSDGSAFQPQAPCVGRFIRKEWTHAHTVTYRSKISRGERYCSGHKGTREELGCLKIGMPGIVTWGPQLKGGDADFWDFVWISAKSTENSLQHEGVKDELITD
jgi:hypothetical protein